MDRKLRMGMIGGGNGAFIGAIHRAAALMDNQIELVCGCFSSRPDVSLASGREYFLSDERIYASFREMIEREAALPEGVRMDFVSIVTPNFLHFEPAMAALDRGFDVVLDKPMTYSLDEAYRLREKIRETGRTLALTHTYSGYPAVKEARERVANGVFGKIRKIYVEYPQGWLSDRAELQPGSNAGWRTDPARAGKAGCMGDIGTHALDLTLWCMNNYKPKYCVGSVYKKLGKKFPTGNAWGDWTEEQFTVEDSAFGFIVMENGATINLESSWALNMLDTREAVTTLCGTDGGLDMNDGIRINGIRHGRQYVLKPDLSAGGVAFYEGSNGAKPEDREAALWIDAVVNDKPPFVLPEQAYAVSQILEGIYISAKTGEPYYFNK